MQIKKLTITPLSKGWAGTVIKTPSPERAGRLITERLSSGAANSDNAASVFRKIPNSLKGFVNPKCKKTSERNFSSIT